MAHLSIRDLQRISAKDIAALKCSTLIKSGDKPVALLMPLKKADPERLREILLEAREMNKDRDQAADDAIVAQMLGKDIDTTDWTLEAIDALYSAGMRS